MTINGNWNRRDAHAFERLGDIDRRTFVKLSGAGAVAMVFGLGPFTEKEAMAQPAFRENPFTLGVASGDPLPDGAVLWTRLAPDPLNGGGMPNRPVPVRWEISEPRTRASAAS